MADSLVKQYITEILRVFVTRPCRCGIDRPAATQTKGINSGQALIVYNCECINENLHYQEYSVVRPQQGGGRRDSYSENLNHSRHGPWFQ